MDEIKIDGRVRRTKRLLKEGLTELMIQKSIKKITVRELSELVEINRGTFYLHYKDIYDLVEQIEDELIEEFEAICQKYTVDDVTRKPTDLFTDICVFLENNRKLCAALLGDNGDINFVSKMRDMIAKKCFDDFSITTLSEENKAVYGYLYSFFESSAIGVLRYWLSDRSPERKSPEEVAALFSTLITKGLYGMTAIPVGK